MLANLLTVGEIIIYSFLGAIISTYAIALTIGVDRKFDLKEKVYEIPDLERASLCLLKDPFNCIKTKFSIGENRYEAKIDFLKAPTIGCNLKIIYQDREDIFENRSMGDICALIPSFELKMKMILLLEVYDNHEFAQTKVKLAYMQILYICTAAIIGGSMKLLMNYKDASESTEECSCGILGAEEEMNLGDSYNI